jgi:tRNA threonylcarbamoyl adenosine modification protein (Sua5/YciO/YrdC/YwlC family)
MIIIPFSDVFAAGNFKNICDCLHHDGMIAYPTDTLYGLGGNFFSLALIEKIDRLKKRHDMPYSVAVGNLPMLESLTSEIPAIFYSSLLKLLPGKFTFLFTASPAIDIRLLKQSDKIGIRLPGLPPLLQLIEKTGLPLVSTSVNRSGQPPLNDPARISGHRPADRRRRSAAIAGIHPGRCHGDTAEDHSPRNRLGKIRVHSERCSRVAILAYFALTLNKKRIKCKRRLNHEKS